MTVFKIRKRQGGKTYQMLVWMTRAPEDTVRVFVAHSHMAAMSALRTARELEFELESWQFISFDELKKGYSPYPMKAGVVKHWEYGFDNIELTLQQFTKGWPISYITGTGIST